ncbi:MAG: hypothetical protein WCP82_05045 [Alphaproteobacteria bacterium]
MKWALIYWLLANAGGYATTGSVDFDDEASCRGALKEIAANWEGDLRGSLPGICVPKGQAAAAPAPTTGNPSGSVKATAPKASP